MLGFAIDERIVAPRRVDVYFYSGNHGWCWLILLFGNIFWSAEWLSRAYRFLPSQFEMYTFVRGMTDSLRAKHGEAAIAGMLLRRAIRKLRPPRDPSTYLRALNVAMYKPIRRFGRVLVGIGLLMISVDYGCYAVGVDAGVEHHRFIGTETTPWSDSRFPPKKQRS